MINRELILERLESLFTKIPIDKADELTGQALQEVVSGFHFAQAQFWIFFFLAYIGFTLVSGKKWSRWINVMFIAVGAWFAMVAPEDAALKVGNGWIAWIAIAAVTFLLFYKKDSIKSNSQKVADWLNKRKVGLLFKWSIVGLGVATLFIPGLNVNITAWLILLIGYTAFALVYDRMQMRSAYLMLVSLFFYWKVGAPFVWILLFSTVLDFYLGKAVYAADSKTKKQLFVALSATINLSILLYFKYFNFIATEWNSLDLPAWMHIQNAQENAIGMWLNGNFGGQYFLESLPMVVGISYYTFQTMSYSIDIYRGQIKPLDNIIDFGFFVSFFPQLVAGPIVRASEFVPQIHKKFSLSKTEFGWALYMILKGLMKKMILADYIAVYFLDDVFASPDEFSGAANLVAIFGYSLQIYGDFAGYTDMAIGGARLFGFILPTNFNSPYKAINCGNFWKRWHITLSSWLRDYLYIPLGGNRGGTKASYIVAGLIIAGVLYAIGSWQVTVVSMGLIAALGAFCWYSPVFFNHLNRNINVTLTMLLGGLWHGASWQFVIWGGLNGTGVLATKYWLKFKEFQKVIAALVVAGIAFLIRQAFFSGFDPGSGREIATIAVWWALIVAAIALYKTLFKMIFQIKWSWFTYYSNVAYGMLHTLVFITFTRIYFRGETMEKINQFYEQLLYDFGSFKDGIFELSAKGERILNPEWLYASDKTTEFLNYSPTVFYVIIAGYILHWVPAILKNRIENTFTRFPVAIQGLIAVVVVIICYQAYSPDSAAFIYYQF